MRLRSPRFVGAFWGIALLCFGSVEQAHSNDGLKLLRYESYVQGLSEKEADILERVFEKNSVLDLEASGFHGWRAWLDELNQRFSETLSRQGSQYPTYRIELIASSEPTAFVTKVRPSGQDYYRGYVFLSTGLLDRMARNWGASVDQLSSDQFQKLLEGVSGVLAHEFSHPKQDELVKWSWRSAQDQSRFNHGQVDEAATDFMAMDLLKQSDLSPEGMLTGLRLLFGENPRRGDRALRAGTSALATHPQDNLRLNLVRGALTQLRMREGQGKVKALSTSVESLRAETRRLKGGSSFRVQLREKVIPGLPAEASEFRRVVEELSHGFREEEMSPERYLLCADLMNEILAEGYRPTAEELRHFSRYLEMLMTTVNDRRYLLVSTLFDEEVRSTSAFYGDEKLDRRAISVSDAKKNFSIARRLKDRTRIQSDLLQPAIQAAFDRALEKGDFRRLLAVLDHGDLFFRPDMMKKIEEKIFERIESHDELVQTEAYLRLWNSAITFNKPSSVDERAYVGLKRLFEHPEFGWKGFFPVLTESLIYHETPTVLLQERVRKDRRFLERFLELADANAFRPRDFARHGHGASSYVTEAVTGRAHLPMFEWAAQAPGSAPLYRDAKDRPLVKNYVQRMKQVIDHPNWQEAFRWGVRADQAPAEFARADALVNTWRHEVSHQMPEVGPYLRRSLFRLHPDVGGKMEFLASRQFPVPLGERLELSADAYREVKGRPLEAVFWKEFGEVFPGAAGRVRGLDLYRKRGLLGEEDYSRRVSAVLAKDPSKIAYALGDLDHYAAHLIWKDVHRADPDPRSFLRKVIEGYRLEKFDRALDDSERTAAALASGLQVHPDYAKVLSKVHLGLKSDFLRVIGHSGPADPANPEYVRAFLAHYDQAKEYLRLIFSPDDVRLPIELRRRFPHAEMDRLLAEFVPAIPGDALGIERSWELWSLLTAKRANRMTDEFYGKAIHPGLGRLDLEERLRRSQQILDRGALRSERFKIELTEAVLDREIRRLSAKAGSVSDAEAHALLEKIQRHNPGSSRYKDGLLEKIAWGLELNESQCRRFVESAKSFNYRSLEPLTLNALSALSVSLEYLNTKEKLLFLEHIQNPVNDLMRTIPTLRKVVQEIGARASKASEIEAIFDHLETFIRDAGETERLVLIEVLVGTRGHGLWHQGTPVREELYRRAGFDTDGDKRILFETHLSARPEYEHSLVMSYILAMQGEGDSSKELLKMHELFGAPGIKLAQNAAILQLYGPERSRQLEGAKNRAEVPSRFEVYEILRKRMRPDEFARIRVRKLRGSGSIKFVVSVIHPDGRREAAYIRRPHLDERISDVLDMADRWMEYLRKHPDYAKAYDYDYYLKTLRLQLAEEVKFSRERQLSKRMDSLYSQVRPKNGWSFAEVPESLLSQQQDDLLFYAEVEGVPFEDLSEETKREVGPYLLETELKFLLAGEFDADRHLGNYLFDPKKKRVYPLDKAQLYRLKPNQLLRPGDPYALAKIFRGLSWKDKKKGAALLSKTLISLHEGDPPPASTRTALSSELEAILRLDLPASERFLRIMDRLNVHRVRLPLRMSLGAVKGFLTVLNEDYAKASPPGLAESILTSFVRKQLIWGARYEALDWLQGAGDWFSQCVRLLKKP